MLWVISYLFINGLIAVSGLEILGIGSSFWALVPGAGLSMLVELKDFGFVRRDRVADEPAA